MIRDSQRHRKMLTVGEGAIDITAHVHTFPAVYLSGLSVAFSYGA